MADQTPGDRAREEGASPFMVRAVERMERRQSRLTGPVGFAVAVYGRFSRQRGSVLAGGLAFFALLSVVPSILSLGSLVALLLDPAEFVGDLRALLVDYPDLFAAVEPMLDHLAALGETSLTTLGLAGIVGVAVSLYAASRVVYVARQVLDVAFEVEPRVPNLLSRGAAIAVTFVGQVAVVVAVLALSFVPRLLDLLGGADQMADGIRVVRLPVAAAVVYLLLTGGMRFGIRPRRRVGWLNVGAALGTLVILVGSVGLGWYLTTSATYSKVISVLGGVVALEIWLYLAGVAIVLSAQVEGVRNGFRRRDLAAVGAAWADESADVPTGPVAGTA